MRLCVFILCLVSFLPAIDSHSDCYGYGCDNNGSYRYTFYGSYVAALISAIVFGILWFIGAVCACACCWCIWCKKSKGQDGSVFYRGPAPLPLNQLQSPTNTCAHCCNGNTAPAVQTGQINVQMSEAT